MQMGVLISMCLCNSKANTNAQITDSSTWSPQAGQHISIRTFRELSQVPTLSHIWIRTETPSNGESFRSTDDLHEGVNNPQMTLTPRRLTAEVSQTLLM
ncbi:AC4 protein [Ramie yellow mosaic virus]|uniref:AC4 protein n=1 Tax=Ramie mosaic Yunnan virus TaxID=1874886 RepID=A0A1B1QKZ1_9GEMI|nr:AC4 protein [Ramie mosaic Yunnan virus]ANT82194.1 AC4 protein [Ramie yellow mosaic virus]ANT82188.1 AC4 protein [Ramie mosaic Yunnan virus]ANT82200.1 AC4 protein [Ramie yellow mosaic virus]AVU88419.1 AC4 protein [Ramie yellow mosaic virus]AVU88425.1 AC4 protein [Ramie yellow mosaic virus]